jgi:predicted transcriptional regulator
MMKSHLRVEARRLREQGLSVREIQKMLGVSKGSVSRWVSDIELTEAQIDILKERQGHGAIIGQIAGARANKEKFRKLRIVYQEAGRTKAREMNPFHMAGCMLYWAEGSKSSKSTVVFVNSDPNMVLFFMRFLREEFGIIDAKVSIQIHCHTNEPNEVTIIEQYWLNLLSLAESNLHKTIYKKGNNEITHRKLRYGVCGIWVNSVEILQHILGAIQEYGSFENPDWLF